MTCRAVSIIRDRKGIASVAFLLVAGVPCGSIGFAHPLAPTDEASTPATPSTPKFSKGALQLPVPTDVRVIHDGPGVPIGAVVKNAFSRLQKSIDQSTQRTPPTASSSASVLNLPIRTKLRVGRFEKHPRAPLPEEKGGFTPFFLIGADRESFAWLANNHDALASLGATGYLIQAETMEDVQGAAAVSGGIPIVPIHGDQLAAMYSLTVYPVLVTKDTVEQ